MAECLYFFVVVVDDDDGAAVVDVSLAFSWPVALADAEPRCRVDDVFPMVNMTIGCLQRVEKWYAAKAVRYSYLP